MEIILDFDGTVCTHAFPEIGKDIGAVPVLKRMVAAGLKLILFTMRSDHKEGATPTSDDPTIVPVAGQYLTEAVNWFKQHDIPLYGIQTNPTQHTWTSSPKAYGKLMIDDVALGAPLKFDACISDRPFIDWQKVEQMLFPTPVLGKAYKGISNQ